MITRVYVWEFPVRLTHWLNVASIVVLSVTGFYIGNPFIQVTANEQYVMGWMRFLHFVTAYLFTMCCLIRLYWAFVGNQFAHWREFLPLTRKRWKEIFSSIAYYSFLRKSPPIFVGHSALAAFIYFLLFLLFFTEIVTGFALYAQSHYGLFWKIMGGWIPLFISSQTLRLLHHLIMWLLIAFLVVHKYIAWIIDMSEKSSVMSSIFSGFKTIHEK